MSDNTNNQRFTVTVVIPAYNAAQHISRAIDSVLTQTLPPDEIIVVDDGSTDDTVKKISEFGDKIKYLYQENAGASVARNTGINRATGEWIAFLDADDEWMPYKQQLQIELLKRNPDIVWVSGNYQRCLCSEDIRRLDLDPGKIEQLLAGCETFGNFFTAFRNDAYGCTDTMIVKKTVLQQVNGFPAGQKNAEDMDLWWRIAYKYPKMGFVNQPLGIYHLAITQSLSITPQQWQQYRDMIDRQLKLAEGQGKSNDFEPCAAYMLRRWIRGMLFDADAEEIRKMLTQFESILPDWYKGFMYLLTAFPKSTARGCHLISKIVRAFNLRRKLVRPHGKSEDN